MPLVYFDFPARIAKKSIKKQQNEGYEGKERNNYKENHRQAQGGICMYESGYNGYDDCHYEIISKEILFFKASLNDKKPDYECGPKE
jgi:hypothetical protein